MNVACQKHKHKSKRQAADHLARIKGQHPYGEGRVYWCIECEAFHIGRKLSRTPRHAAGEEKAADLTKAELLELARNLVDSLRGFT